MVARAQIDRILRMANRLAAIVVVVVAASAAPARADVTRVEITTRVDIAGSSYEKLAGTVYFAVDPKNPHNAIVVDLDKAPRNAAGLVEFSSDFYVLRPKDPARSNGAALVEVSNRGGRGALRSFNRAGPNPDPETAADLGDGFLMKFGFTIAWVGWEFDVRDEPGLMRIHLPVATDEGKPITGIVRAVFTPGTRMSEVTVNDLSKYDAIDPAGPDSQLMVRPEFFGTGRAVQHDRLRVASRT